MEDLNPEQDNFDKKEDGTKRAKSISSVIKPNNVSQHLWEKFKALEKRTNTVTQRSTAKRIKHLQTEIIETVTKEFTSPEDKDILRQYDVKFGPPISHNHGRKRKADTSESAETSTSRSDHVTEVLNMVSSVPVAVIDHSRPPPPTALEKNIDQAIKTGNLDKAEALSDHLANREMGEKIVTAFDAKAYLEQKMREKESVKAKKKKQLAWGFQHKQRWETKGNM